MTIKEMVANIKKRIEENPDFCKMIAELQAKREANANNNESILEKFRTMNNTQNNDQHD